MARTLIVYHSLHGNTRAVAEELASRTGGELIALTLPGAETLSGFRMYARLGFLASFRLRPRIEAPDVRWADDDQVIIGTPVWAGTFSPAIRSFFRDRPLPVGVEAGAYICHKGGPRRTAASLAAYLGRSGRLPTVDAVDPGDAGAAGDLAERMLAAMGG